MFSPLLDNVMQYGIPVLAGIVAGFLCRAFFAHQMQGKIKDYQYNMVKSHAKILELEAKNDRLEKLLKNAELSFSQDKIFMN